MGIRNATRNLLMLLATSALLLGIPAAATARFAQVPSKTWICHGPAGTCSPAK